jgi:hypothetical protein
MAFPQHILYIGNIYPTIIAVKSSTNLALCYYVADISLVIIAAGAAYELNILCHLSIFYQCLNLTLC